MKTRLFYIDNHDKTWSAHRWSDGKFVAVIVKFRPDLFRATIAGTQIEAPTLQAAKIRTNKTVFA